MRQRVHELPVARIRPEEGLGRKRDREGHRDLQRSIQQFGVLTPITVRRAPGSDGNYLLIKGQGRTLACRLLGIETIPAIVVDDRYGDSEKVQQFLVENVARLKMRPIDRALLIARARADGEETAAVARRFGVSPATVRKLQTQLDGATSGEVAALRSGAVNLALHAAVTRHVAPEERAEILAALAQCRAKTAEVEALLVAIGWRSLHALGPQHRADRISLLKWALKQLGEMPNGSTKDRLTRLAARLPVTLPVDGRLTAAAL